MVSDKAGQLSSNYKNSALIEAVMEYYLFYELDSESIFPEQLDADDNISLIRECFRKLVLCGSISDMTDGLEQCRNSIIGRMHVLTACVDRFLIYEYVINRIEAGCTMTEEEMDEKLKRVSVENVVADLADYIFQSDDMVVVNDRIHEVISQLPVRMARSKFLEYVKNSIRLFSDSDTEALDSFLYMIRNSAMIYEPEGMETYFPDIRDTLKEFENVDYSGIDREYYKVLREKLRVYSSLMQDITDVYISLQKITNMLYAYALNEGAKVEDEGVFDACLEIAEAVNNAFDGEELQVDELFSCIEGVMERLYEQRGVLEAMLGTQIPESDELFVPLKKSERLMSTSLFAGLDEAFHTVMVDEEYMSEVTGKLISDLQEFIRNNSRPVVRAVYAAVLDKLPVIFNNFDEVVGYIRNSLEQCGDKSELFAVYSLLDDIVMDGAGWDE